MTTEVHVPAFSAEVLAWFRARAKGLKGAFDADLVRLTLAHLPGWSIETTAGLLHVNETSYDVLRRFQTLAGIRGEDRYGKPTEAEAMQDPWEGRESWWAISRGASDKVSIALVSETDRKGRPLVERPMPGVLYVTSGPTPGQWGQGPLILWVRSPAIGVTAWRVTAPSGASMLVLDKPRHDREPLKADAFWKWAYAEGLSGAAQAALPTKAQEEAAARAEAVAKGLGTCGVCFQSHALHTKSGVLVQHGYAMTGGHGHGHFGMQKAGGDCFGVSWQPFEKSPNATQAWGAYCARRALRLAESARAWEAGEFNKMWLLHTKPQWGQATVQECGQYTLPVSNGRQSQRVEEIGPDHPEWGTRVAAKVASLRERSAAEAATSAWYLKAAKAWPAYPEVA